MARSQLGPTGSSAAVDRWHWMLVAAAVLAGLIAPLGPVLAQEQKMTVSLDFGADIMGPLNDACELDRLPLDVRVVARSPGTAGRVIQSVPGGWLVLDKGDVVLLDDGLRESKRWGLHLDERLIDPDFVVMLPTGELALGYGGLEPQIVILGRAEPHLVFGSPTHAVAQGRSSIIYGSEAGFYELDTDDGIARQLWSLDDFGMPWDPENGVSPEFLLRVGDSTTVHVAWTIQSSIWTAGKSSEPQMRVQRCVPEPLTRVHNDAPRISVGAMDNVKASVVSLADFIVMESGEIAVLGGLRVGDEGHLSIELYAPDGSMKRAWVLPLPRESIYAFSFDNPARILSSGRDRHLVLYEVAGAGYPGTRP